MIYWKGARRRNRKRRRPSEEIRGLPLFRRHLIVLVRHPGAWTGSAYHGRPIEHMFSMWIELRRGSGKIRTGMCPEKVTSPLNSVWIFVSWTIILLHGRYLLGFISLHIGHFVWTEILPRTSDYFINNWIKKIPEFRQGKRPLTLRGACDDKMSTLRLRTTNSPTNTMYTRKIVPS